MFFDIFESKERMKRRITSILILTLTLVLTVSPVSAKTILYEELEIDFAVREVLSFVVVQDNTMIHLFIEESRPDVFTDKGVEFSLKNEAHYQMYLMGYLSKCVLSEVVYDTGRFKIELGSAQTYYLVLSTDSICCPLQVEVKVTILTVGEITGIVIGSIIGVTAVVAGLWFFYFKKKG